MDPQKIIALNVTKEDIIIILHVLLLVQINFMETLIIKIVKDVIKNAGFVRNFDMKNVWHVCPLIFFN